MQKSNDIQRAKCANAYCNTYSSLLVYASLIYIDNSLRVIRYLDYMPLKSQCQRFFYFSEKIFYQTKYSVLVFRFSPYFGLRFNERRWILSYIHLGKHCDKHTLYIGIGNIGIDDITVLVLACLVAVVGLKITVATALSVEL